MRNLPAPKCLCDCHKDGCNVLHCVACCEVSGKFIDKNGKVDILRYKTILDFTIDEQINRKAPYIDGGEYIVKNKYNVCSSLIKEKRINK